MFYRRFKCLRMRSSLVRISDVRQSRVRQELRIMPVVNMVKVRIVISRKVFLV